MNLFMYDEFQSIFEKEVKTVFSQFINYGKDKKPYIFIISAPEYIAINHPKSYCIAASGNTIVDYESAGRSYISNDENDLYYKYCSEEWNNHSFTVNDFPKSNAMILDYIIEINDEISDDDCNFTGEFMEFRTRFFEFLIKCLQKLRRDDFFDLLYPEKILINFEVREYYDENEMIRIFEKLNTKDDAILFAKWL